MAWCWPPWPSSPETRVKEIFYEWGGANAWLFHAINNFRGKFVDGFMQLGTFLGEHDNFPVYLALVILTATAIVARTGTQSPQKSHREAQHWLGVIAVFSVAYVIDGALVHWLKETLDFPRPPLVFSPESLHLIGKPEYRHSLPSGHSAFAITVAASLWPVLNRYWRVGLTAFVVWVGLSRVSLGVHFPTDVLAGFLVGFAVVLLARALVMALIRYWART